MVKERVDFIRMFTFAGILCVLALGGLVSAEQVSTADLNGDNVVNLGDVAILASRWLCACDCGERECGDDGCGGACGQCMPPAICQDGECVLMMCDHAGFEAVDNGSAWYDDWDTFIYVADLDSAGEYASLVFELYPWGGPFGVGTYEITGENYATADFAIVIYAECDAGYANCGKIFYAHSGTLTITDFGDAGTGLFAGSLSNVELVEVTIDQDYVSTPVEGGENWCIPEYSFFTMIY